MFADASNATFRQVLFRSNGTFTLLEIRPAAASYQQGVAGEGHALVLGHQRHASVGVSWRFSHSEILRGGGNDSQFKAAATSGRGKLIEATSSEKYSQRGHIDHISGQAQGGIFFLGLG